MHREEAVLAHQRNGLPVHLLDIHMEKGMHCVDCHFVQDVHGNTRLHGEVRAAIEIQCIDCHGTIDRACHAAHLRPGGVHVVARRRPRSDLAAHALPAAAASSSEGNKIYQNSMVEENLRWEVVQTADTIDPASEHYNAKSRLAKTVRFAADGSELEWGGRPEREALRSPEQPDELHRLPFLLEPQLLRLPSCRKRPTRSCRACTMKAT